MRTDIGGARPAGSARHGLAAAGAKPARALVIAGTQGASRRRRTGTTGAIGIGSPRDGHARRTANWGELLTRKIHRRGGKRLLLMALRLCDQAIRPSEEGAALRTQCTGEQLEFHALGRRSVTGRCDGGHISSDGGCLATGGLGARCATPLRRATRSRPRPRGSRTAKDLLRRWPPTQGTTPAVQNRAQTILPHSGPCRWANPMGVDQWEPVRPSARRVRHLPLEEDEWRCYDVVMGHGTATCRANAPHRACATGDCPGSSSSRPS